MAGDIVNSQLLASPVQPEPVWKLSWLTPGVCRIIFALLLTAGFFGHLHFLHYDCPIDLSGDEAQYWDWSRQLDLSYYSKGPMVAYIIRASCELFGDNMPAVRYPALLIGVLVSITSYLLALKLFRSDRVALGTVLLYHLVPLFVAGSLLMTIDPPFFFCWALATYLLAIALFDRKRWPWPIIGIVAGLGFLAKFAMFLWFVPALLFIWLDLDSRPLLRTRWPWLAILIALPFTMPVVLWNARHDWVTLGHVTTQTGTHFGGPAPSGNVLQLIGGQAAVLGPGVFVLMLGAVVFSLRRPKSTAKQPESTFRPVRFLALIGVTFLAMIFLDAFRAKVQMNWPTPAYFTLLPLTAYFISTRLRDRKLWKPWRPWFYLTVAFGILSLPIIHHPALLYPLVDAANPAAVALRSDWSDKAGIRGWTASKIPAEGFSAHQLDFATKLKGWEEVSAVLSQELARLGEGSFALCHDYQQAAELAFYLKGQPRTYYAASYYRLEDPGRLTQYDMWPNRDLGPKTTLLGKNAIFLGHHDKPFADLTHAFDRVEGVSIQKPHLVADKWLTFPEERALKFDLLEHDAVVRTFRYFRCYGFKGMAHPANLPR